jgi:hypothetical protein
VLNQFYNLIITIMENTIKKSAYKICLMIALAFGLGLGFNSQNVFSQTLDDGVGLEKPKITCHSSSTISQNHTYTSCSTCTAASGIGSDEGECRPNY